MYLLFYLSLRVCHYTSLYAFALRYLLSLDYSLTNLLLHNLPPSDLQPAHDHAHGRTWALSIHVEHLFALRVVLIDDQLTYLKALFIIGFHLDITFRIKVSEDRSLSKRLLQLVKSPFNTGGEKYKFLRESDICAYRNFGLCIFWLFGFRQIFNCFISFTTTTNWTTSLSSASNTLRAKFDDPVIYNIEINSAIIFLKPCMKRK